jgi:Tol biopolymer transport system component
MIRRYYRFTHSGLGCRVIRCVFLVLFLGLYPVVAEEFPLKTVTPLTYLVDYEPFWSPDGRYIVLISSRHGGMKVHVLDADDLSHGSKMLQLTTDQAEDDSPAWSPDGTKIAFVSIRVGVSQICVMNANGTEVRQLTNGTSENIHPTWSPDGKKILFNTTHFSNATAANGRNVPSDNKVIGEQIDKKMELATIRPDGTDLKRITNGGGYTYASFSSDGTLILHRRVQGELSQIFVMNADGSNDRNISGESKLDGWPAWSPDGERVIFSRRVRDRFQICVMNRDGSSVQQLTDPPMGEFTNPRWSPDGRTILCTRRLGDINLIKFPAPK